MVALQLSGGWGGRVRQGDTVRMPARLLSGSCSHRSRHRRPSRLPRRPGPGGAPGRPQGGPDRPASEPGSPCSTPPTPRSIERRPPPGRRLPRGQRLLLPDRARGARRLAGPVGRRAAPATRRILYLPERDPGSRTMVRPQLGPGPEATRLSGIEDVRPAAAPRRRRSSSWSSGPGPRHGQARCISGGAPRQMDVAVLPPARLQRRRTLGRRSGRGPGGPDSPSSA